ncbi:hypothetical protein PAMA_011099 [Pampus argenteus]
MAEANTTVKLLLRVLARLCKEIISGCQELEVFITNCATRVWWTMLPRRRSASVAIKMPVMFDRCESHVKSNTAYLCWEVAGVQSNEPWQEFEIHIKNLQPAADQRMCFKTCQSYSIT